MPDLPIEDILSTSSDRQVLSGIAIGRSRQEQPIEAFRLGEGPTRISLIGGCHADEPVGPSMLRLFAQYLGELESGHPLMQEFEWSIVPHVNPDGARLNAAWSDHQIRAHDAVDPLDFVYDPALYVHNVVRELPGDDIEFGFPASAEDSGARPENQAVARWLAAAGPVHLHGSFHGMGFAPGPWFLIEPSWIDRTTAMRAALRKRAREMGYTLLDIDRRGEKGFTRIDEGFSTRPESGAMREYFLTKGDHETAAKFRPSSMEFVRSMGGDPLTLVSEMPLFLVPQAAANSANPGFKAGTAGMRQLHDRLRNLGTNQSLDKARAEMTRLGIRAMPIRHQMRLQLSFLQEALRSIRSGALGVPP